MNIDRDIKLRDLFWGVISHWKAIIIIVIIGGIIGGAYSYLGLTSSDKESTKNDVAADDLTAEQVLKQITGMTPEKGAEKLFSGLTSTDISNVDLYCDYQDLYKAQLYTNEKVTSMSLDPYNSYQGRYLYCISTESLENLDAITMAYSVHLNDMKGKYGNVFSFNTETYGGNMTTAESQDPETFQEVPVSSRTASLQTIIYAKTKEECIEKLDGIDEYIMSVYSRIKDEFKDHEINKIGESCYKVSDSSVIDLQKKSIDSLNAINTNMANLYKTMSPQAQAFITYLGRYPDIDARAMIAEGVQSTEPDEPDKSADSGSARRVRPKWVVLGAVVGFVIIVVILAIAYAVSTKMRYEDDSESMLGVPCLGKTMYGSKKKPRGLDRIIANARYKHTTIISDDESAGIIAANILAVCGDKARSLYATGASFGDSGKGLADAVGSKLREKGIDIVVGEPLFVSAAGIEEMCKTDGIILFESTASSNNSDVLRMIRDCSGRGKKTIGVVLMG